MTRHSSPRFVVLLAAPLLLMACGDDTGPVDATSAPTSAAPTTAAAAGTRLSIMVGTEAQPSIAAATLTVDADGAVAGTGYLTDAEAAAAAVALLAVPANVTRLTEGEPAGQVCTEIYGGPDVAVVTGAVDGTAVDTTFHRGNGCGIADWDTFTPLVGRPRWAGEQRIYFRDETAISVNAGTQFVIELVSNATTGFEWVAEVADPAVAEVGGSTYISPPDTGTVGVGGWQQFPVTALAAGTTTITFEYRRPFEPADAQPADTVTFTVTVMS